LIEFDGDEFFPPIEVEEPGPRTLLVKVRGELDERIATQLRAVLDEELTGARFSRVVLDLSRVTLLASPALDLLRRLRRRCRVDGRHLVLVGTGHPTVHRPLRITGLLPLFDTRPTLQSVLQGNGQASYRSRGGGATGAVPVRTEVN
jgi:anti-anti-sigma factor